MPAQICTSTASSVSSSSIEITRTKLPRSKCSCYSNYPVISKTAKQTSFLRFMSNISLFSSYNRCMLKHSLERLFHWMIKLLKLVCHRFGWSFTIHACLRMTPPILSLLRNFSKGKYSLKHIPQILSQSILSKSNLRFGTACAGFTGIFIVLRTLQEQIYQFISNDSYLQQITLSLSQTRCMSNKNFIQFLFQLFTCFSNAIPGIFSALFVLCLYRKIPLYSPTQFQFNPKRFSLDFTIRAIVAFIRIYEGHSIEQPKQLTPLYEGLTSDTNAISNNSDTLGETKTLPGTTCVSIKTHTNTTSVRKTKTISDNTTDIIANTTSINKTETVPDLNILNSCTYQTHRDRLRLRIMSSRRNHKNWLMYLKRHICVPTALFVASCTEIMFDWFYYPDVLPVMYQKWISKMANMDECLLDILRQLHAGKAAYGQHNTTLTEHCKKYEFPIEWGNLKYGLLRCNVVHPASGSSCLHNVWMRWCTGFQQALRLYLSLQCTSLIVYFMSNTKQNRSWYYRIWLAAKDATYSSAFLGTFISIIWGTICLSRHSLRNDTTGGVLLACFLCGFSLLLEKPSRRLDLACYVLPRALTSFRRRMQKCYGIKMSHTHGRSMLCITAAIFVAFIDKLAKHAMYAETLSTGSVDLNIYNGVNQTVTQCSSKLSEHAQCDAAQRLKRLPLLTRSVLYWLVPTYM